MKSVLIATAGIVSVSSLELNKGSELHTAVSCHTDGDCPKG